MTDAFRLFFLEVTMTDIKEVFSLPELPTMAIENDELGKGSGNGSLGLSNPLTRFIFAGAIYKSLFSISAILIYTIIIYIFLISLHKSYSWRFNFFFNFFFNRHFNRFRWFLFPLFIYDFFFAFRLTFYYNYFFLWFLFITIPSCSCCSATFF